MQALIMLGATGGGGTPPGAGDAAAGLAAIFAILLVALVISFALAIVICFLVYNVQKAVPPEHRQIEPGLVWLLLIPLFNLVWNFFVYPKVADSYKSYFNSVGRTDVGDCGRGVGMAYCICAACAIVPCVNYLAGPAALVLFIIFLVKVYGLKGQLGAPAMPPPMPPSAPPMA